MKRPAAPARTGGRTRAILHVDMDAFYAAVEVRENPSLAGKPLVIGTDPQGGRARGVVSTASYEARKYGIHSAQPISVAYRRCPHAVFIRPRISLYAEVSRRIFDIFGEFTDQVEGLSLDEAFLDVTASERLFGRGPEIARAIRARIREQERLTASVGVAASKYVAKVASDLDKPDGLVIVEPGREREFLAPLDISRLWGAGKKAQERLRQLGLKTIGDVARLDPEYLEAALGTAMGGRFHRLANGLDARRVHTGTPRKSLSKETTFAEDVDDRARVERTLLGLCEGVARSVRKRGLLGRTIQLKLRWDGFETHTRQQSFDHPITTTEQLWPPVRAMFREIDDPRRRVRLVGVGLSGFDGPETEQLGIFGGAEDPQAERATHVAEAVDALMDRFGRDAVTRAALLRPEEN